MDDKAYLEDDFDPKSVTAPQLRGILSEYNVDYQSSLRKPQLIDLFNKEIYSKRKSLLDQYKRDIQSVDDNDFIDMTSEGKKSKKTKKKAKVDQKVNPDVKVDDTVDSKKSKSKSKKSKSKTKESETDSVTPSRETSPFSSDNIFQSPPDSKSGKRKHSFSDDKSSKKAKGNMFDDDQKLDDDFLSKNIVSPKKSVNSIDEELAREGKRGTKKEAKKEAKKETIAETKGDTPKKDTPKKDTPKKDTPKKDTPKKDTPKKNTPQKDTPKKNTPQKDTPQKDTPQKDTPKKDTPQQIKVDKITPKKDTPKDTPESSRKSTPKDKQNAPAGFSQLANATPKLDVPKAPLRPEPEPNKTLEEETKDFDKNRKKTDEEIAEELGIKFQGLPQNYELTSDSFSKLTPKPRRASIPSKESSLTEQQDEESNEDSDEEEEEEENDEHEVIKPKSLLPTFLYIIIWFILMIGGLFGYWYREQTFLIGYCSQEIDEPTFYNPDYPMVNKISGYLDNFKPACIPCPPHARCFDNLQIGCFEDFIEFKPWYYDIAPFLNTGSKKCVPDTKKAEKLELMINFCLDLLRSKNALVNCGQNPVDNYESGLQLDELYELLLSIKAPYITIEEFNELWERSIVELEKEPEIITKRLSDIVSANGSSDNSGLKANEKKILRSVSLSNLNLKCQLQNRTLITIMHYKKYIISFMVVMVTLMVLKLQYNRYINESKVIDQVYNEVLQKLKDQKRTSTTEDNSYIGSIQLRDLILQETNLKRKLNLWNTISKRVENNSNVNYKLVEHYGEIIKVWEWISDL